MFKFFDRKEIYFKNRKQSVWLLGDIKIVINVYSCGKDFIDDNSYF